MNVILIDLEKWISELGISTKVNGDKVLANKMDIAALGITDDEFLTEIKSNVNKRIFVAESTVGWLFLGCF